VVAIGRVTQAMVRSTALSGLQDNLTRTQQLQSQLSSGKLVSRPSDNPAAAVSSMQLRGQRQQDDQFLRNIDDSSGRLNSADTALQTVSKLTQRAKELMVTAQDPALPDESRNAIATELSAIKQGVVDAYNTRWMDRPVFGGTVQGRTAIEADGTYIGNEQPVTQRISRDVTMRVDVSGSAAGADELPGILDQAIADIQDNDYPAMQANQNNLDGVYKKVLNTMGDVGARTAALESTRASLEAEKLDFTTRISGNEDVDLPKAIMDLQSSQVAYEAALGSAAKILQVSLLDYLR
jgi:flagellar hook-associated protein 3 FlgL